MSSFSAQFSLKENDASSRASSFAAFHNFDLHAHKVRFGVRMYKVLQQSQSLIIDILSILEHNYVGVTLI